MYAKSSYILNAVMEIHARFTAAEILGWIVGWIVPTGPAHSCSLWHYALSLAERVVIHILYYTGNAVL
jgi:hypothetical protein